MKKLTLTLTLISGLTLSSVAPLQAMQPTAQQKQISPRLIAILKKKYIKKEPLTADEKAYFDRVKTVVGVSGLVLLLVGTIVGLGWGVPRLKKGVSDKLLVRKFEKFGVKVDDEDWVKLRTFIDLVRDNKPGFLAGMDLEIMDDVIDPPDAFVARVLYYHPEYAPLYYDLSQKYPYNFRNAMGEIASLSSDKVPIVERSAEGQYFVKTNRGRRRLMKSSSEVREHERRMYEGGPKLKAGVFGKPPSREIDDDV